MTVTLADPEGATSPSPEALRAAFRDLHGTRLHGFALLLTLGDPVLAASLAGKAIADGSLRVGELRHPERAAAWLRAHVVRGIGRAPHGIDRRPRRPPTGLATLSVEPAVRAGLARVDRLERAVLIAAIVERFDRRDVATIVGRDGPRLETLMRRAREAYVDGFASAETSVDEARATGGLIRRIQDIVERAVR
ncbi:MAG: hypothetical protein K5924_09980 [Chloroflexi bacterium]|nr:hypothetical protein [Chloroflexota bacterium]